MVRPIKWTSRLLTAEGCRNSGAKLAMPPTAAVTIGKCMVFFGAFRAAPEDDDNVAESSTSPGPRQTSRGLSYARARQTDTATHDAGRR